MQAQMMVVITAATTIATMEEATTIATMEEAIPVVRTISLRLIMIIIIMVGELRVIVVIIPVAIMGAQIGVLRSVSVRALISLRTRDIRDRRLLEPIHVVELQ
jgi:hypothetical protein